MDDDQFYAIRTAYYLGDFPAVAKEAKNLSNLVGAAGYERDSYLCRAYIAQGKFKQAKSIFDSSKTATQFLAVKQLCLYKQACLSNSLEEKELVIDTLKTTMDEEQESVTDNNTFCVIASQIFIEELNYKQALSLLSINSSKSLEKLLMEIQIYLKIHRSDLAEKTVDKMKEMEDDDPLTLLASAQVSLYIGGNDRANSALEILDDLCHQNDSAQLRNMMVVASMAQQKWTEAWRTVKKARDLAKQHDIELPVSTYVNSIVCLQHLNKGHETLDKLYSELEKNAPNHSFLQRKKAMEALFDKSAQNIKL